MSKQYPLSLHVFRRDLRLQDNTALIAALASSERVIPCFIFDTRQINQNEYRSDHCLQFMMKSLTELNIALQKKQSHLYFFYGIAEDVIKELLTTLPIKAVFINRDYTPFSKQRDKQIQLICDHHQVDFHCYADALLHEPEEVLNAHDQPYKIFTHAFKYASQLPVRQAKKNNYTNYYQTPIALTNEKIIKQLSQLNNPNLAVKGGRDEALTLLKKITRLANYAEERNYPALASTSKLSAHNKFGTLSIREVYASIVSMFGDQHTLITELYWRDFFTHLVYHYPHVFKGTFYPQYDAIPWTNNKKMFTSWCTGNTGFPIVDAGMRELNQTGYMHNRVRMITASFLVKDLHIDWRWGERYFAQKLVDYDPAVNNGNWQWSASTGCDAQPYFRIFNPWLQQKKYDADCIYIKQWIPELTDVAPAVIHQLASNYLSAGIEYPSPLVNHTEESRKTQSLYRNIVQRRQ